MAVLVSHNSELWWGGDGRCAQLEHYPFGIERSVPVQPFSSAEAMWDPGGRVMALKLVLHHLDSSNTEYQGVGRNGERAQETARALNAYLSQRRSV